MDRDRLRRIIAEELARVLGEVGRNEPVAQSALSNLALVCFTGDRAPDASVGSLLNAARRAGWALEALPSYSFREVVLGADSRALGDLAVFARADDEAAAKRRIEEARVVVFPEISTNSLNKAALGLTDSLPTRAIAQTLGAGRGCVLLETVEPDSPLVGLRRLETLRRLERQGATLAGPENFIEGLKAAASPLLPGTFRSASGLPVGRSPASRSVITVEDVAEAARRGVARLTVPANAIITDRAREEARRLGVELLPGGGNP